MSSFFAHAAPQKRCHSEARMRRRIPLVRGGSFDSLRLRRHDGVLGHRRSYGGEHLCIVGRGLAPAAGNWHNSRISRRKNCISPVAMWFCKAKPPAGASSRPTVRNGNVCRGELRARGRVFDTRRMPGRDVPLYTIRVESIPILFLVFCHCSGVIPPPAEPPAA